MKSILENAFEEIYELPKRILGNKKLVIQAFIFLNEFVVENILGNFVSKNKNKYCPKFLASPLHHASIFVGQICFSFFTLLLN